MPLPRAGKAREIVTVSRFYRAGSGESLYLSLSALLRKSLSRGEFLAELARRGHPRTARWHEEWVQLGLIAPGERVGRPGGGMRFLWPYVQVEHANAMLDKLAQGTALGSLPKYVVWVWLVWGDEWIPFAQVPRAMRTWEQAERTAPVKNVRASAAELVNTLAHQAGVGKRRLVRALTDFAPNGDVGTLRDPLTDVVDPNRTGLPRGPEGAAFSTDGYLAMIAARQRAAANLRNYSESAYRAARKLYAESRAEYATAQPAYAKHPDLGAMHHEPTVSDIADSACIDLLTCLAILFEREPRRASAPAAGRRH